MILYNSNYNSNTYKCNLKNLSTQSTSELDMNFEREYLNDSKSDQNAKNDDVNSSSRENCKKILHNKLIKTEKEDIKSFPVGFGIPVEKKENKKPANGLNNNNTDIINLENSLHNIKFSSLFNTSSTKFIDSITN